MLEVGANFRDVCIALLATLVSIVSYVLVKRGRKKSNDNPVKHKPDDKPTK